METKTITIEKDVLIRAYKNGSTENKALLECLYGKEVFDQNIMDRVKTFEDAVNVLGDDNSLVIEYRKSKVRNVDLLSFLKLRIITAALNEGWEPKFAKNEYRYYPYFFFYTKKEYNEMSKDERNNAIILFDSPSNDIYAGLAFAISHDVPSYVSAYVGSRLCFKTKELAEYAGKQFIDLYTGYYRNCNNN